MHRLAGRASFSPLPRGDRPLIRKAGHADVIAREARGARIAGPGIAPDVVVVEPGAMTSVRIAGAPRDLSRLAPDRARALGALIRQAHERRRTASGALPGWRSRVASLTAYARRRGADATARTSTPAERDLVARATALVIARAPTTPRAFRFLHGDLVQSNVVWGPNGPVLVDWEFHRQGDPAEDLAYLEAVNGVPARVSALIREGYRAGVALSARVEAWHPLVLLDAGLWYRDAGHHDRAAALIARAGHVLTTPTTHPLRVGPPPGEPPADAR